MLGTHQQPPPAQSAALLADLVAVLLEFFEAAVHTVLHARRLYSAELFERARIYNLNVRRSRHPQLNDYIHAAVSRLKPVVQAGTLRELAVVFFESSGRPFERVTFSAEVLFKDAIASGSVDVGSLESSLSSVLLKLQFIDALLKPLPAGCRFEVVAYSSSREGIDMTFYEEDTAHTVELSQPIVGQPLKSVTVPRCLNMQVLLEEAAAGR